MKTCKVVHNRKNCIGCNSCVTIAPQNWVINPKDGKATLIGSQAKKKVHVGDIFAIDIEANKRAAEACPMRIIKVEQ